MAKTPSTSAGARSSLWPPLVVCGLAAISIDLSLIHREQHADSYLYALVSLYRWTPFLWEQNRVGMLVPLLAMPIKNPLFNLLVQDAVFIFAGLAAPVLLARYMLRDATFAVVGLLSAAGLVAFAPPRYSFEYLIDTQYGVWLSLGLAGLILLEQRGDELDGARGVRRTRGARWARGTAACVLIALAHWVYCTAAMFLGPLVVGRALLVGANERRRPNDLATGGRTTRPFPQALGRALASETVSALAVLAAGFGVGLLLMRLAPDQDTRFTALPITDWPVACIRLAGATWQALAPQWWPGVLVGGAMLGLALSLRLPMRGHAAHAWRCAIALFAAAALVALFLATRQWVRDNQYNLRYLLPCALFTATALTAGALAPWLARHSAGAGRVGIGLSGALLLLGAWLVYGGPSPAAARRALAGAADAVTAQGVPLEIRAADVMASRCTHLAGGYWRVWPAVFRANWQLYERGEQRVVWGVTERSGPTSEQFQSVSHDQRRVGVYIGGDDDAHHFIDHYRLGPLDQGEAHGSIALFKAATNPLRPPRCAE